MQVLASVSEAWELWSADCENWLTRNGNLQTKPGERKFGSVPTLRTSTHSMAPCQSVEERQPRRWIRRLAEAKVVTDHAEKQALHNGVCGLVRGFALNRFHELKRTQTEKATAAWSQSANLSWGAYH